MRESKRAQSIRLPRKMYDQLKEEAERTGKSMNGIIEEAVIKYFEKDDGELADLFIEKFDKKYGNVLTRIRLAAGTADKNIETLLNIKNTELFIHKVDPDNFISMYELEHEIIKKSTEVVKRQIALYKQKKDNKRNG